jgi:hypothetical protein
VDRAAVTIAERTELQKLKSGGRLSVDRGAVTIAD